MPRSFLLLHILKIFSNKNRAARSQWISLGYFSILTVQNLVSICPAILHSKRQDLNGPHISLITPAHLDHVFEALTSSVNRRELLDGVEEWVLGSELFHIAIGRVMTLGSCPTMALQW